MSSIFTEYTETASGTQVLREFGAEKILSYHSASSAEDVAYAVVRGAALRRRAVHYPYSVARVLTLMYPFIPSYFEQYIATVYERN